MSLIQQGLLAVGANVLVTYTIVAFLNGSSIMIAAVVALWIAVVFATLVWFERRADERERFEREWRRE